MPGIFLKKHIQGKNVVIAAADEELIGKEFRENNRKLTISNSFYRGELLEIEKVIGILKKANNFNIVGQKIVQAAIEAKIIHELAVISIQGIPHALKFVL
ncbi:MAG: hypothetical protein RBG13Loki_2528 [Promethearchaeota archaeon CR_4]|nr:MAG: hypothetical protein RBG13Loki_2528 [Candidatus Lokiarchaeota archaeon CR_4]